MQLAAGQRGLQEPGQDCKVLRLLQGCLKPDACSRSRKANCRHKSNFLRVIQIEKGQCRREQWADTGYFQKCLLESVLPKQQPYEDEVV